MLRSERISLDAVCMRCHIVTSHEITPNQFKQYADGELSWEQLIPGQKEDVYNRFKFGECRPCEVKEKK